MKPESSNFEESKLPISIAAKILRREPKLKAYLEKNSLSEREIIKVAKSLASREAPQKGFIIGRTIVGFANDSDPNSYIIKSSDGINAVLVRGHGGEKVEKDALLSELVDLNLVVAYAQGLNELQLSTLKN